MQAVVHALDLTRYFPTYAIHCNPWPRKLPPTILASALVPLVINPRVCVVRYLLRHPDRVRLDYDGHVFHTLHCLLPYVHITQVPASVCPMMQH